MLPIISLFGLAMAAALWPEPSAPSEDSSASRVDDAEGAPSPDMTVSETNDQSAGVDTSVLSVATSQPQEATDTAFEEDHQDDLIDAHDDVITGTAGTDALFGYEGDDVMSGSTGADLLDGGVDDDRLIGDDDTDSDTLIGGEGHDQIWVGDGDTATGGRGDDIFHMDVEGVAFITDYNPDDDRIELVYDPAGPVPELTAEPTNAGINLLADGDLVAVFDGAKDFDLSRVAMVAEGYTANL